MKLQYPHILEGTDANLKKLCITLFIDEHTGKSYPASTTTPEDWKNFRHIVGNLYYGWDNEIAEGEVYVCTYE